MRYKHAIDIEVEVHMICPECRGKILIKSGKKQDVRVARCKCGKRYEYSCWQISQGPDHVTHKIEAFEIAA